MFGRAVAGRAVAVGAAFGLGALMVAPVAAGAAGAQPGASHFRAAGHAARASGGVHADSNAVHANGVATVTQAGAPTDSNGNPVSNPMAALQVFTVQDLGGKIDMQVKTAGMSNPLTDVAWTSTDSTGAHNTFVEWDFFASTSPSGSTPPTYAVDYGVSGGSLVAQLLQVGPSGTGVLTNCAVTPTFASDAYHVSFPASCIGSPQRIFVGATISYDPTVSDPTGSGAFGDNIPEQNPLLSVDAYDDSYGYWMFAKDGGVFNEGSAVFQGSLGNLHLNAPIVGGAPTKDGKGYWMVAADGGVFNFNAPFYGSAATMHLNAPVVGMAVDHSGKGYWLVASDGGVFNYNVPYLGSAGNLVLNKPVVGGAASSDGAGYYLVASDGGVFNYHVPWLGSAGNLVLNKPIVGMATALGGYDLVASDGGVFNYQIGFEGSTGDIHLNQPIVGMATTTSSH